MSTVEPCDVIVAGGGVMGCATARALAEAGCKVALIEAASIGHGGASSHGRARILRLAYGSADYIALCRAAYPAWRALERELGEPLVQVVGGLDLALEPAASWDATAAAMAASAVPFELLERDAAVAAYPQFDLPAGTKVLHQRDTAVLHADRCLAALAGAARRAGATIREGETIRSVRPVAGGIEVSTDRASYAADRLVLAVGPGTADLLEPLGVALPLTVSKEHVAFFEVEDPDLYGAGRFPIFIVHLGEGRLASGFPLIRDPGVKLMVESRAASPLDDLSIEPGQIEKIERTMRALLPGLGRVIGAETCRYTLTPDEDFILDRLPAHPQIILASPCSGHGFKFAPLFGAALADLCLDRAPGIDLTPFRIDRPALAQTEPKGTCR